MDDRNNTKREYDTYLVYTEELLYKLSDAGLLDKLCRVKPSKKEEGKRIWFFDRDPAVGAVIREYLSEQRKQENKEN